ncbi:PAS domain-containing protein [Aliiroseovarius subalbicans]|uniref:PAS domain-containing protein n=1 Tax=Aliiroseovarius subalbicans TaxID=2925840 RepID=UPI001F569B78|nr:PAS domain-containing protein [Aliiroseovarius subalbicans]MCI2400932.1 PAS domain-containing protein [Aliiroseovarius subalbicans]
MNASNQSGTSTATQKALQLDAEILSEIIAASSDACWCMEFGEPVDLTAPDREIVRQVFENDPFWRLSNPAMAQLYLLDPDKDFNSRPTAEIFSWNEQNEAFVRALIRSGFEMDAGPALDMRYDGVEIFVENDVRAHIENGLLLRIFGIVRDVGKHRLREERFKAKLDETLDILTDLPCGVIAFNDAAEVILANPAACEILGETTENLMAESLSTTGRHSRALNVLHEVIKDRKSRTMEEGGIHWSLAPRRRGGVIGNIRKNDEKAQR